MQNAVIYLYVFIFKNRLTKIDDTICKVNANGYNQKCAGNDECDKSRNLICKDGVCQCRETSLYWNERSSTCGIVFKSQIIV